MNRIIIILISSLLLASCSGDGKGKRFNQNSDIMGNDTTKEYGYNRDFLKKHVRVIEFKKGNSEIALVLLCHLRPCALAPFLH
jgi:hypothetical protein